MLNITRRIAEHLFRLKAEPTNEVLLTQAHEHLDNHGIDFFKAVIHHFPVSAARREPLALDETPTAAGDEGVKRYTWKNHVENQVVQPLQYLRPTTLDELRSILGLAVLQHCRVKAIGSGHSFSDVGTTTDFLIDTHGLDRVLELDVDLLKDPSDAPLLFKTECGIVIRDLNAALDEAGLALINMGGYTAQTIIGAISTSTHGSGIGLGPLSSAVVSLELAAADGRLYQIEPANGITDPLKFRNKHPDIELKQDDDWFYSNVVSLGCMGVVYSVTLRVIKKYWLSETRTLSTWTQVKSDLRAGTVLAENRHYEVLVNPYEVNGQRVCLVTRRNFADEPTEPIIFRPHRNFFAELIGELPGTTEALLFLFDEFPHLTPRVINWAMNSLVDENYVNVSYEILDLGSANKIAAYSSEIGFPMSTYLDAVETIMEIAEQNRDIGHLYHTAPFSLRFVKAASDYLSMQYGEDTCMIEMPMVNGTIGGKEILARYEKALFEFGGRPHWGQINFLTGSHDLIRSMYPKHDVWLSVFKHLNESGMFNNTFTDRCGFSADLFVGK